jgi:glycosyltransferase involved in cell wall biosynthesis
MSDGPLRVLQVLTDDDRRGAQVFGVELGARLGELGDEVRTVALAQGATGGLDVEALGPSRRHLRTLFALERAMAGADVTIGHGSTTLPMCGLASLLGRHPFVYRQISDPLHWTPTRSKRARTRLLYRRPTRVVALSTITSAILQEHFGVDAARIDVIPNAVDERRCPPADEVARAAARARLGLPPAPQLVIGYVGALAEEKGVADLIEALPAVARLVVAGEGPQRRALEEQARTRGVAATFLGSVDDPWDVYAAADALVLPSRAGDSQPAVLIEAALVGTPTVSTDVGAISDIVVDGETGRLVAPGDVGGLRTTLAELAAEPARARSMAASAEARARQMFSMSAVAGLWRHTLVRAAR